jgi:hypothetical protein
LVDRELFNIDCVCDLEGAESTTEDNDSGIAEIAILYRVEMRG